MTTDAYLFVLDPDDVETSSYVDAEGSTVTIVFKEPGVVYFRRRDRMLDAPPALTGKEQEQPDAGKFFAALAPTRTLTYQPPLTGKGQE